MAIILLGALLVLAGLVFCGNTAHLARAAEHRPATICGNARTYFGAFQARRRI